MIPVNTPLLDGNEAQYLESCIKSGWISSEGEFVKRFERDMAKLTSRQHGIALANGTAALDIAMQALKLESGDEVIMPDFTIISCASAVLRAGGVPIFVDADATTWNMDVAQVEERITPRTRAIMVVHIYGLPTEMKPILELALRYGLKIIEDAAEAHGMYYNNQPCGSFGVISTFSFYANKLITTGEGGMVLTDDPTIASECRSMINLRFTAEKRFQHEELGWNYRMTNLQAAVGVAQLERIDFLLNRKKEIGARYLEGLSDLEMLTLPVPSTTYADNAFWVFGLVLSKEHTLDAQSVMQALLEKGVGTRPFFWPMHSQAALAQYASGARQEFPVSSHLGTRGFYIPSGNGITDIEIEQVIEKVREVLK